MSLITLPSTSHQLGDKVGVTFFDAGFLKNCEVVGIRYKKAGPDTTFLHFDLRVITHIDDDGTKNYQNLYNIPNGLIMTLQP